MSTCNTGHLSEQDCSCLGVLYTTLLCFIVDFRQLYLS